MQFPAKADLKALPDSELPGIETITCAQGRVPLHSDVIAEPFWLCATGMRSLE
jgi:hypothetical protein